MSTLNTRPGGVRPLEEKEDPFRYGWREVRRVGPDGQETWEQVPLTEEDILHPLEGDVILQSLAHDRMCHYVQTVLRIRTAALPEVGLMHDCRTDWEEEGIKPHCPDFVVLKGVKEWYFDPNSDVQTARLKTLDCRPILVIEITSETTRNNDLVKKVKGYYDAKIPWYVIIDRLAENSEPRLIGYRHTPEGYIREALDELGRLWVEPVGLWLAWEGNQLVALDERGNAYLDVPELAEQVREAEKRAADEERGRLDAERRLADMQSQLAQMEAELRRLRGDG
jgi:Uma2 family endonuclease